MYIWRIKGIESLLRGLQSCVLSLNYTRRNEDEKIRTSERWLPKRVTTVRLCSFGHTSIKCVLSVRKARIELALSVLETEILPLNYSPFSYKFTYINFFKDSF